MKTHDRRLIHLGFSITLTPAQTIDRTSFLRFQAGLESAGIVFESAHYPQSTTPNEFVVSRLSPPMQISVRRIAEHLLQLVFITTESGVTVKYYKDDIEALREAFVSTWPSSSLVVGAEMTFRCLYETDAEHAFQELWEGTLGQPTEILATFERPILGGGVRFVLPPINSDRSEGAAVEVKIESFLADTSKMFVETIFQWQVQPTQFEDFDISTHIAEVDAFVSERVVKFITVR